MLPQSENLNSPPVYVPKKSKSVIIFVAVLVILLVILAAFGTLFFKQKYFRLKPQDAATANIITSPVDISNPGIKSYGLFYFFEGNIEKIEDTADGLKITLDIPQKDIPEFIVAKPGTRVVLFKDSTYRVTTPDSLKPGQKVTIAVSYYSNLNRWLTQSVAIEVSELPPGESITP